jgi:hypothetical protein
MVEAYPEQIIVADFECDKAPYYLRIQRDENTVLHVELADINGSAKSLVAAVQCATREGYNPTHHVSGPGAAPSLIPTSVVREPAFPGPRL